MNMFPAQRNLPQPVTYWAPLNGSVTNAFGHVDTKAGEVIQGRWEDNVQQVRKPNGEEVTSMSTVYLDRSVEVSGYLMLGEYEGETLHIDAQEIQNIMSTPDLRNLSTEWRAFL